MRYSLKVFAIFTAVLSFFTMNASDVYARSANTVEKVINEVELRRHLSDPNTMNIAIRTASLISLTDDIAVAPPIHGDKSLIMGANGTNSNKPTIFSINDGVRFTVLPNAHIRINIFKIRDYERFVYILKNHGEIAIESGASLSLGEDSGIVIQHTGDIVVKQDGVLRMSTNLNTYTSGGFIYWDSQTTGRIILEKGARLLSPSGLFIDGGIACTRASVMTVEAASAAPSPNYVRAGIYKYDPDTGTFVSAY